MDRSRRSVLKNTLAALLGLATSWNVWGQEKGSEVLERLQRLLKGHEEPRQMRDQEFDQRMKRAVELETQAVEQLYSTKPVRVILGPREYIIPAHYFGPKEKDGRGTFVAERYFGFALFLPEYGGYTKENWIDPFDRRLITVVEVSSPNRVVREKDPWGFGDSKSRFEKARALLDETPIFKAYGLEGYRPKHSKVNVAWTGARSNGEFIYFRCNLAPGDPRQVDMPNPLCDVRYHSEREDLFIVYRYSNDHLEKWREIDDAIWAKLRSWRVK